MSLSQSLRQAQAQVAAGQVQAEQIVAGARARIGAHPETVIDYIVIVDPETLEEVAVIDRPVRMAMAVSMFPVKLKYPTAPP